ncbi:MAG: MBL fold metallo-hydrolase [Gemmatimonadaceae bacterium]
MKLCLLGSGSRGNSVLIQSGQTRILIDAGFGPRTIAKRLLSVGVNPSSIEAVVLTHEHTDHSKGVRAGAARWGWKVFATRGTQNGCESLAAHGVNTLVANEVLKVGDVEIFPVSISHDATEPVAVIATDSTTGVRAGIVYDLGVMSEGVQRAIEGIEILVIESNHDGEMLRNGPYPAMLKRRIAGNRGHLSNRAAGGAAAACAHRGLAHVVLAHLSETNNTPRVAVEAMRRALVRTAFAGSVIAAQQDVPSQAVGAGRSSSFGAVQLSLGL